MEKEEKAKEIFEQCSKVCKEYNIVPEFSIAKSEMSPAVEWSENTPEKLGINCAKLAEDELESYIWYYVQKMVLPVLRIETERLIVRRLQPEDSDAVYEMNSQEEVCINDGYEPFTERNEEYEEYFEILLQDKLRYAIELKDEHRVIGVIHLSDKKDRAIEYYDLGYAINQNYWRRGYGYEAISSFLNLCYEQLQFRMVTAGTFPWNEKSTKMLEKLEFTKEGTCHKALWHDRFGPTDLVVFYREK